MADLNRKPRLYKIVAIGYDDLIDTVFLMATTREQAANLGINEICSNLGISADYAVYPVDLIHHIEVSPATSAEFLTWKMYG